MTRIRVPNVLQRMARDMRDARGNTLRGGVLVVPAILDADAWEKLAAEHQDVLIASASEDRVARRVDGD